MFSVELSSFFSNSLFLSDPINLAFFAEQPCSFSRKWTAPLFFLLCPPSPNLQQLWLNLVVRAQAGAVDLNPLTLRRSLNRSQLTSFWVSALTTAIKDEQQHHHHPSLKIKSNPVVQPSRNKAPMSQRVLLNVNEGYILMLNWRPCVHVSPIGNMILDYQPLFITPQQI